MRSFTVVVIQKFYYVKAEDEIQASRQVEDLVKTGGFSPYMDVIAGSCYETRPVDET